MYFFIALALLADFMDWYAHSLTFLAIAVFLYGINRITDAIGRTKL